MPTLASFLIRDQKRTATMVGVTMQKVMAGIWTEGELEGTEVFEDMLIRLGVTHVTDAVS
jgi:hypothetical protein